MTKESFLMKVSAILIWSITLYLLIFFKVQFVNATTTLYSNNFEDGNVSDWTEVSPWGSWTVQSGDYIGDSSLLQLPAIPSYSTNGDEGWEDYEFETILKGLLGIDKQVLFRVNEEQNSAYIFNFRSQYFNGGNDAILAKRSPLGTENASLLSIVNFTSLPDTWYKVNVKVKNKNGGVHIQIYVDDFEVINYQDNDNPILNGKVGFEVVPGGYMPGNPIGLTTRTSYQYATVETIDASFSVPTLKQYDPIWKNVTYDSANVWAPGKAGIGRWGCAITSAAMILQYHGHNITPDALNTWLKSNNGYVGNGLLNWSAVTRWAFLSNMTNPLATKLEYKRIPTFNTNLLDEELNNQRPAVIKLVKQSDLSTHFVVATNKTSNDYGMNDPATTQPLLSYYPSNSYNRIETFTPSNTDLSYLYLYTQPNTSLRVFAPDDTEITEGFFIEDPLEDQESHSRASGSSLNTFSLAKPQEGSYVVNLKGQGSFNLNARVYDNAANLTNFSNTGTLKSNQELTYFVTIGQNQSKIEKIDFNYLKRMLDKGFEEKHITNKALYKSLLTLVDLAQTQTSKGKVGPAKFTLSEIAKTVKLLTKKTISEEFAKKFTKALQIVEKGL